MSTLNPLTQIDFYKSGHIFQYPAGTESVYSNFTARSDRLAPVLRSGLAPFEGKVVFVGLQGFVKEFLIQAFDAGFFRLPKAQAVRQYRRRMDNALGPAPCRSTTSRPCTTWATCPCASRRCPKGRASTSRCRCSRCEKPARNSPG